MAGEITSLVNIDELQWQARSTGVASADVLAQMGSTLLADDAQHLRVEAYKIDPGRSTAAHMHQNHFELVFVWSGTGSMHLKLPDSAALGELPLRRFDTVAIPLKAVHNFSVPAGAGEELVLLTIHGLNGEHFADVPADLGKGPSSRSTLAIRNIDHLAGDDRNWEKSAQYRAKRIRVWGKEARVESDGSVFEVDAIKRQLHFTLYTFLRGQTNPGHFHPHSVEFVLALDSGAQFTVRRKKEADDEPCWDIPDDGQETVLEAGDMVLVPMAAWHQYFNSGNTRCKVMALQTPHPIMHTLIDETNGLFGPRYPEPADADVSPEA